MNAAYTPLSVQRHLRSISDKISNFEERTGFSELAASLKSILLNLQTSRTRLSEWLLQKQWNFLFFYNMRGFNKRDAKTLFENPAFLMWIGYIEKRYPEDLDKQAESIYSILANHYSADVLVNLLAVGLDGEKKVLAGKVVQSWIGKKSEREVFDILKLDQTEARLLFGRPAFSQWISFVSRSYEKSLNTAMESSYEILSVDFRDALKGLLAETYENPDPAVFKLQKMQLEHWKIKGKSVDDVFTLLGLTADARLLKSSSGKAWLGYLYLLKNEMDLDVLEVLKLKFGDALVAGMLWVAIKEGASTQRAKELQELQFQQWDDKKTDGEVLAMLGKKKLLALMIPSIVRAYVACADPESLKPPSQLSVDESEKYQRRSWLEAFKRLFKGEEK